MFDNDRTDKILEGVREPTWEEDCKNCTALRAERDDLKDRLMKMCVNQQSIGRCKYNKVECEKCGCPAAIETKPKGAK